MIENVEASFTAFAGQRRLAAGDRVRVALAARRAIASGEAAVLIFNDATGEQVELDDRGADDAAHTQADSPPVARGPGRPRLGVVAREVTLLPRHWEWLNGQPGGASVALRKLVEAARRVQDGPDRVRRSREAAYRFMTALAGNLPGFEEAIRSLFAGDRTGFDHLTGPWPPDIRDHAGRLAANAFPDFPVAATPLPLSPEG